MWVTFFILKRKRRKFFSLTCNAGVFWHAGASWSNECHIGLELGRGLERDEKALSALYSWALGKRPRCRVFSVSIWTSFWLHNVINKKDVLYPPPAINLSFPTTEECEFVSHSGILINRNKSTAIRLKIWVVSWLWWLLLLMNMKSDSSLLLVRRPNGP